MKQPLIIAFTLVCSAVFGQNLVPNPSFEEHSACPEGIGEMYKCDDWEAFRGTPDYFNSCGGNCCGFSNSWGNQQPSTGEAYAAFYTYQQTSPNLSEQIGIQLLSSLVIGEKYFISFYVSTGYTPLAINITTNKIGAVFTTYPYYHPFGFNPPPPPLPNMAHVYTDSIVSDTVNWLKITGSFIADSAYEYIVIGKFFDDDNLDTLHLPYSVVPQIASYYLDDVCVSTDSLYAHTWTGVSVREPQRNTVSTYPNPTTEVLSIKSDNPIRDIMVLDIYGRLIVQIDRRKQNQIDISVDGLTAGIYTVVVVDDTGQRHTRRILKK